MDTTYNRFVAMGDSQTEGVGDPYPNGKERGWADRFAESLVLRNPEMLYANLAIRGRCIGHVREEQLGPALRLEPDLVSLMAGLNDMIRPGFDLDRTIETMDEMQKTLRATGATVLTITYPDPTDLAPIGRFLTERTRTFNQALREVAEANGTLILDLEKIPVTTDPRIWCDDRLHLNSEGHQRLAHGMESLIGGDDDLWIETLPPIDPARALTRLAEDARWVWAFFLPWIGRRITGKSSGDDIEPKRPELAAVTG
ncbi:MAG: SGNH/GDSL hydrolase family protein [Solirubrobacterales bacterium]|nr:SGNH/GDSL hydrolase family protein [Solirubrobacterales bacterium]